MRSSSTTRTNLQRRTQRLSLPLPSLRKPSPCSAAVGIATTGLSSHGSRKAASTTSEPCSSPSSPAASPREILSQGDNFFVFHLLAQGDLYALKKANAHFSDDLLSALLNEPLVGHGIFWSSAPSTDRHARPYPLSVRVLDFNKANELRDPAYDGPALDNYAAGLRRQLAAEVEKAKAAAGLTGTAGMQNLAEGGEVVDIDATYRRAAINQLRGSTEFRDRMRIDGMWWWRLGQVLAEFAPSEQAVGNQFQWAMQLVPQALNEILGEEQWVAESREYNGRPRQWIKPTGLGHGAEEETDEPPF